jgi:hypothetical protein
MPRVRGEECVEALVVFLDLALSAIGGAGRADLERGTQHDGVERRVPQDFLRRRHEGRRD